MSSDLQWLVVRNNSSFLVKRNGVQFSREAGNLMNLNSYKFNGLVNTKTVDVALAPANGKKTALAVSTKRGSKTKTSKVTTQRRNKKSPAARSITAATAGHVYRADLSKYAVARAAALSESLTLKQVPVRKTRGKSSYSI